MLKRNLFIYIQFPGSKPRVKGNSLIYSLFVMLVVTIISSSLILYAYLNNRSLLNVFHKEEVMNYVTSGVNLLLDNAYLKGGGVEENRSLFGIEGDHVTLQKYRWGMYTLIHSEKNWHDYHYSKTALTGAHISPENRVALYLSDKEKPLSLCGRSRLKGKVLLPKAGLKTATIEGEMFTGEGPDPTKTGRSKKDLPINAGLFNELSFDNLKQKYLDNKINSINPKINEDTLENKFTNKAIVMYGESPMNLSNTNARGHVVFFSETSITVNSSCYLEDVLLIAPSIFIGPGFKGSIQAFARDTIAVFENVTLEYPSVLCALDKNPGESPSFLFMDKQAQLQGIVVNYCTSPLEEYPPITRILEESTITGQLLCNGIFEHKGIVKGMVFCNYFYIKTPVSVYENHLFNAVIDVTALPVDYCGVDFTIEKKYNKVVKWLH